MINTVQSKIIQYLYAATHHPKLLPFALEHLSIEQVRNEYFRLKLRDNLQSHNRLLSLTVNHTNTSIPVIRLLGLMRRRSHLLQFLESLVWILRLGENTMFYPQKNTTNSKIRKSNRLLHRRSRILVPKTLLHRLSNINYNTNILRILHQQEKNKSSTLDMLRKIGKPVTPFSTVSASSALFQATRGFPYAIVFMMLSLTFK